MTSSALIIETTDPRSKPAQKLIRALAAEEALRYHDLGPDTCDSFQSTDALAPRSIFLLAQLSGEPVACGALRPIDASTAEINRLYVAPATRRRGIGRALLQAIELHAVAFGYQIICLETGNRQPEAIALYTVCGFHPTAPFGSHAHDPISVFFAKKC